MHPLAHHSVPFHRRLLGNFKAYQNSFKHVPIQQRLWNLVSFRNIVTVIWLTVVYWGERTVFRDSMEACQWDKWEKWPPNAQPYRLALIADPQLVDPHTYDRRGISLKATIFYSDLYMKKAYSLMNSILMPQAVVFLGDLFDGGREWSTDQPTFAKHLVDPHAPADWKTYGEKFWENEFIRFNSIFPHIPGIKSIRSLPGNHDLGIGNGIERSVLNRFKAFFGDTSSVHTLGNHTFVLIDSVSLENTNDRSIYEPARQFLDEFTEYVQSASDILHQGPKPKPKQIRELRDPAPPEASDPPSPEATTPPLPKILLTHVPLYRKPNTPCGPLRESSKNSISITGGFQYQNVLTSDISGDVLKKVQPVMVFSGDDHDYCEVLHTEATGMVKEITVKSFSFTMGMRKPGFLLVSLWNPLDGTTLATDGGTIQTKLCLMPDQLGIFQNYFLGFGLMKFALTLSVIISWLRKKEEPLLPLTQMDILKAQQTQKPVEYAHASSWSGANGNGINTRHSGMANNKHYGGYGIPSQSTTPTPYHDDEDDKYAKKPMPSTGLGISGLHNNIQHNIDKHLMQLGNAAEKVGNLMADKMVETVPSLGAVVESGREIVRREKKTGMVRRFCGKLGNAAREWGVVLLIVGGWYWWLVTHDV